MRRKMTLKEDIITKMQRYVIITVSTYLFIKKIVIDLNMSSIIFSSLRSNRTDRGTNENRNKTSLS